MDQGSSAHPKGRAAFYEPRDEGSYTLSHMYDHFLPRHTQEPEEELNNFF